MYKEDILHCLRRVSNTIQSQVYLNGNGEVEAFLAENIMTRLVRTDLSEDDTVYFCVVKEAFSLAFRDLAYFIRSNDQSIESNLSQIANSKTFDDFQSKVEAWRTTCLINKFFLNCDMSIIY